MSSQDRREATPKASRNTADTAPGAVAAKQPETNYPPKVRYQDQALPNSHRPVSA